MISLPQLFLHYMHETSFENLLVIYRGLPIIVSERANEAGKVRGTTGGKHYRGTRAGMSYRERMGNVPPKAKAASGAKGKGKNWQNGKR